MKQELRIYSPIGILVRWSTNTPIVRGGYIYFSCFIYNIIRKRRYFSKAWSETGAVTFGVFLFQNAFLCCKNRLLARDTANKLCLSHQQALQQAGGQICSVGMANFKARWALLWGWGMWGRWRQTGAVSAPLGLRSGQKKTGAKAGLDGTGGCGSARQHGL
jgi:hypothetical protein